MKSLCPSGMHLLLLLGVSTGYFASVTQTAGAQALRQRPGVTTSSPSARVAPSSTFGARGQNTETGVLITSVTPGSPVQAAGLEVRDVVITVEGFQVGNVGGRIYDLESEVVGRWRQNPVVTLVVRDWRTGDLATLRVDSRAGGGLRPPFPNPGFGDAEQIRYWFETYLDREPTRTELISWEDSIRRGTVRLEDVEAYVLGGHEFYDRYGRNNDLGYVNALFSKKLGRRPSVAELSRWVSELKRYPSARVDFVKRFLRETGTGGSGGSPSTSTTALTVAIQDYQGRMSRFATWGYYGEQSSLVYSSLEAVRQIEQYSLNGYGAVAEQQRLARQLVNNSERLLELSGMVLERAKSLNLRVTEARDLVRASSTLREEAARLARQLGV